MTSTKQVFSVGDTVKRKEGVGSFGGMRPGDTCVIERVLPEGLCANGYTGSYCYSSYILVKKAKPTLELGYPIY